MSRPQVVWLDAREEGLSVDELRERARSLPLTAGTVHVSRSYCYPFALVAGYGQRVGVDVERVAACDGAFAASIQTPAERVAARDARRRWPRRSATHWTTTRVASTVRRHGRRTAPGRGGLPAWMHRSDTSRGCAGEARCPRPQHDPHALGRCERLCR
jgi:hypothetical protein